MQKVVCIDASGFLLLYPLVEGGTYEVSQSPIYDYAYIVTGYEMSKSGNNAHYEKRRFLPTSTIDETELLEQRNNHLQGV